MNINKKLDKNVTSISNTIENKRDESKELFKLTYIIEKALFEKVYSLKISGNNKKKTFHKDFNLIFSIFKKIYEARDTKSIFNSNSNYILKFILSLDDKEYNFIEHLLNKDKQKIFTQIYKKYKKTQSKELYKALSKIYILFISKKGIFKDDKYNLNVKNTILNPQIKKNKYIIIPDDNASNLKKLYFILLVVFSSCIEIIINIKNSNNLIKFLKKILLNYKKNTISINQSEDVKFAIVLGCLCDFDFSIFINTISQKIIEEKNKKNIDTRVKSSKNISDLFEIFLELDINKNKSLTSTVYFAHVNIIKSYLYGNKSTSSSLPVASLPVASLPVASVSTTTSSSASASASVSTTTSSSVPESALSANPSVVSSGNELLTAEKSEEELGILFNKIYRKIMFDIYINNFSMTQKELNTLKSNIEELNKYKKNKILMIKSNNPIEYFTSEDINGFIENINIKIKNINNILNVKNIIPIINRKI